MACLDDGHEYGLITKRSGIAFCSYERSTGQRVATHDPAVNDVGEFLGPQIKAILGAEAGACWWVVCPRRAPKMEAIARQGGYRYFGPSGDLCDWLNHKANFSGLRS